MLIKYNELAKQFITGKLFNNSQITAIDSFTKWLDETHPMQTEDKLDRIVLTNFLLWGIPSIPTLVVYMISKPFINTGLDVAIQLMGVVGTYLIILAINYGIYWDKYYDKFINDEQKQKVVVNPDEKKEII